VTPTVLRAVADPVCGHVLTGPTGTRWVCIAHPHGPDDPPPPGIDRRWWGGGPDSHHYVRLEETP
jgi:hypothetical protein